MRECGGSARLAQRAKPRATSAILSGLLRCRYNGSQNGAESIMRHGSESAKHKWTNSKKTRLFRERRSLIAVSIVLLAHQLLGITVGNSTDSLGLHFQIADPSRLWWGVWLVWLWTMVCYIQQFYSLKPWTTYPKDRDYETRDRLSDLI